MSSLNNFVNFVSAFSVLEHSVQIFFKMLLKIGWILSVLSFCSAVTRHKRIVGGYPALIPEANGYTISEPPGESGNIIFVEEYYRSATIHGTKEPEGYYGFKGIRYAKPPIDKLRFQVKFNFKIINKYLKITIFVTFSVQNLFIFLEKLWPLSMDLLVHRLVLMAVK